MVTLTYLPQKHPIRLLLHLNFLTEQQTQTSFAVALNGQFVSKATYQSTALKENDALDILFPIVGG